MSRTSYSLKTIPDLESGSTLSVVHIDGIRNGSLVGSVHGDVRLVAGDHVVQPDASGAFAIHDTQLLTNVVTISIPDGMHFVASKKGKKYYPVDSASAQNLSLDNRVYFPTASAAEAAGYSR
jgi:hypothetical protein